MSTLLERACGFGDGASEMIELEALRTALVLTGQDIITATRAKALLGLTPEQGNEFDAMMELQPGTLLERVTWADRIVITIDGARRGLEALDSESNIRFALGLPELVPLNVQDVLAKAPIPMVMQRTGGAASWRP